MRLDMVGSFEELAGTIRSKVAIAQSLSLTRDQAMILAKPRSDSAATVLRGVRRHGRTDLAIARDRVRRLRA